MPDNAPKDPKLKRQMESYTARCLLKKAAEKCGYEYLPEMEMKTEKGKPVIKSGEWCFSIAHSNGTVIVAISDKDVGIDIQRIGDVSERVVERFLKKVPAIPLENTLAWTDYEALGKFLGTGIPLPGEIKRGFEITRFCISDYAVTVCHEVNDVCFPPEELIGVNVE